MENQVVLTVRLGVLGCYFTKWSNNTRHVGDFNPYLALFETRLPYKGEGLSEEDYILVLGPLIKWSE